MQELKGSSKGFVYSTSPLENHIKLYNQLFPPFGVFIFIDGNAFMIIISKKKTLFGIFITLHIKLAFELLNTGGSFIYFCPNFFLNNVGLSANSF